MRFRTELAPDMDPHAQQENDEVEDELLENNVSDEVHGDIDNDNSPLHADINSVMNNTNILHGDQINEKLRSLNIKQRQIFEVIYGWAKDFMKNLQNLQKLLKKYFHFTCSLQVVEVLENLI